MTTGTASKNAETMKRVSLALPGILTLSLALTLLPGCGQKAAGEPEQSAQTGSKAEAAVETPAQPESKAEAAKPEAAKGARELEAGYAAMDAKDYATAVEHFTKSADEGSADAMLMLYVCYCEELGVKRQEEGMGDKYLKPAAETGNGIAMAFYASYIMVEEHDEARGLEMLERVADNGCAYAQYLLVILYQKAKQYKKTGKYLQKLAELPLTDEKCVLDHIPGAINNKRLFDEKAVIDLKVPTVMNKIIVSSQAMLGALYADGADGIEPDREKAKQWLKTAGENGYAQADQVIKMLRLE